MRQTKTWSQEDHHLHAFLNVQNIAGEQHFIEEKSRPCRCAFMHVGKMNLTSLFCPRGNWECFRTSALHYLGINLRALWRERKKMCIGIAVSAHQNPKHFHHKHHISRAQVWPGYLQKQLKFPQELSVTDNYQECCVVKTCNIICTAEMYGPSVNEIHDLIKFLAQV